MQNPAWPPVDVPRPQQAGGLAPALDNRQLWNHWEKSTRFPQLVKLQFHSPHHHSAYISALSHSSFKIVLTFLLYVFWSGLLTSFIIINIWESPLSQRRTTQQIQDSDKIHIDANDQRVQSAVEFSPYLSSNAIHTLFEISSSTAFCW